MKIFVVLASEGAYSDRQVCAHAAFKTKKAAQACVLEESEKVRLELLKRQTDRQKEPRITVYGTGSTCVEDNCFWVEEVELQE